MTDIQKTTEETRKVARRWFDALDKGDYATAMDCLADDIEWVNLPKMPGVSDIIPWLGTCNGKREVAASFATRDKVCQIKVFKPLELTVENDVAWGTVNDVAIIKPTGLQMDIVFATWMKVREGKIVQWKSYCDSAPIVVAFRGDLKQRLLDAVDNDDAAQVEYLLNFGADPNARDKANGLTALMLAACHANTEITKMLLAAGADVLTTDSKTGATALHKACQGGNVEVARMLLDAGAFIDAVTPPMGHTPIMDALWYKWPELVQLLADRGANLNLSTHYGFSTMEHFEFELNVNTLGKDKLLQIGEIFKARQKRDEEAKDQQKVMAAASKGDIEAVREAIRQNADVNTVYPHVNSFLDGHTPLLVAARDGHTDMVRDLLEAGAEVRVEDWVFKGAPIHKATYNGKADILRLLIQAPDIDIDVQGPINGYTPIHDALWHGYTECARILLDAGARLDLKGHDGKLPVDVAADVYGKDAEIVRLIRERMARTEGVSAI